MAEFFCTFETPSFSMSLSTLPKFPYRPLNGPLAASFSFVLFDCDSCEARFWSQTQISESEKGCYVLSIAILKMLLELKSIFLQLLEISLVFLGWTCYATRSPSWQHSQFRLAKKGAAISRN